MASAFTHVRPLDDWIDQEALSETWHEITGDSL